MAAAPESRVAETEVDEVNLSVAETVTSVSFASSCIQLLHHPLKYIDDFYSINNGIVPYNGWSALQKACIGIVTCLLGTVMMCGSGLRNKEEEEKVLVRMMECVKLCHCGGLSLLEWKQVSHRTQSDEDDYTDDQDFILSLDNVAILSCLLLSENCFYLPAVLSHQYRLHLGLLHTNHLLELHRLLDHKLIKMALVSFMVLVFYFPHACFVLFFFQSYSYYLIMKSVYYSLVTLNCLVLPPFLFLSRVVNPFYI